MLKKLPRVSPDEQTFEKTPKYFEADDVSDRMIALLPNARPKEATNPENQLKIVILLCDPVTRHHSDFYFTQESRFQRGHEELQIFENLNHAARYHIGLFHDCLEYKGYCEKFPLRDLDNLKRNQETNLVQVQLPEKFTIPQSGITDAKRLKADLFNQAVRSKDENSQQSPSILMTGLYSLSVDSWLKNFKREDLIFLDGDQLISDTFTVLRYLRTFPDFR